MSKRFDTLDWEVSTSKNDLSSMRCSSVRWRLLALFDRTWADKSLVGILGCCRLVVEDDTITSSIGCCWLICEDDTITSSVATNFDGFQTMIEPNPCRANTFRNETRLGPSERESKLNHASLSLFIHQICPSLRTITAITSSSIISLQDNCVKAEKRTFANLNSD